MDQASPPILTFDLEEWFNLLECDAIPGVEEWGDMESRVEANTDRLLDILDKRGLKATFFVLGWVARRYPALVRRIASLGHEIGCHSDIHSLVWRQTPPQFREETARALNVIGEVVGTPVTCYRAPGFSITSQCLWAFEALLDLGVTTDCSVFPGAHAHGGTRTMFPDAPFRIRVGNRTLLEFPVSLARLGPLRLAFVGGGYFRMLPLPLISHWTRKCPGAVTYFHPRDFDAGQPRITGLSPIRSFKAYVGIGSAARKLDLFLECFGGQTLGQACASIQWEKTEQVDC